MSPEAPAAGANGARKIIPIRPAVPFKWERPLQSASVSRKESVTALIPNDGVVDQFTEETPKQASNRDVDSQKNTSLSDDLAVSALTNETTASSSSEKKQRKGSGAELQLDITITSKESQGKGSKESPEESGQPILTPETTSTATLQDDSSSQPGSSGLSPEVVEAGLESSSSQPVMDATSPTQDPESSEQNSDDRDYPAEAMSDAARMPPPDARFSPVYSPYSGPMWGPPQQPMYAYQQYPLQNPPQYFFPPPYQGPDAPYLNQPPSLNMLGGRPPPTPSSASMNDGSAAYNFDTGIAGHISSNFNVKDYSDMCLKVIHENDKFPELTFYLHKLMVARSETLRDLMSEYAADYDSDNKGIIVVKLRVADRFVTPAAMEAALRSCYGEPVWHFTGASSRDQKVEPRQQAIADMDASLSFAAAGHLLKLTDVAMRGLEIADSILCWDNLEQALSFGLEACSYRKETPENALLTPLIPVFDTDSMIHLVLPVMRLPSSSSTTPPHFSSPGFELPLLYEDRSPSTQIRCALDMLKRCIQLTACFCPDSWGLQPSARPLAIVDRLPAVEFRATVSRQTLANIQFGELGLAFDRTDNNLNRLISSIVLSLPYDCLVTLLRIAPASIIRQARQIINERERRRLIVLDSESFGWNQRRLAKDTEWLWVGHREYVNQAPGGLDQISNTPVTVYRSRADQEMAENRDRLSRRE